MKSLLKKLVVVASISGLVSTTSFAVNNEIAITAQIGVVTVVGFADVSAETLDDTFVNATAPIDLGLVAAGTDFGTATVPMFIRHNDAANPVRIALSDASGNGGNLYDAVSTNTVPMTYTVLTNAVAVDGPAVQIIAAGVTDLGSVSVGDFVAIPTAGGTAAKAAGTYTTTLTVAITSI